MIVMNDYEPGARHGDPAAPEPLPCRTACRGQRGCGQLSLLFGRNGACAHRTGPRLAIIHYRAVMFAFHVPCIAFSSYRTILANTA